MVMSIEEQIGKKESAEQNEEKIPQNERAQYLNSGEKLRATLNDPITKEAFFALLRTLINVGISVVDLVPGIGELPSWVADAIKVTKEAKKKSVLRRSKDDESKSENDFWQKIDPTPDVPVWIALGSEATEAVSGSVFPSHAIESSVQLIGYDLARITAGLERLKEIWGEDKGKETIKNIGQQAEYEIRDYRQNQMQINQAMQAFA